MRESGKREKRYSVCSKMCRLESIKFIHYFVCFHSPLYITICRRHSQRRRRRRRRGRRSLCRRGVFDRNPPARRRLSPRLLVSREDDKSFCERRRFRRERKRTRLERRGKGMCVRVRRRPNRKKTLEKTESEGRRRRRRRRRRPKEEEEEVVDDDDGMLMSSSLRRRARR